MFSRFASENLLKVVSFAIKLFVYQPDRKFFFLPTITCSTLRMRAFISELINIISVYKLGDEGISSNLIGSLSLTNGHCPPPRRWIMKQWPAGVNFRFDEVTENDIPRIQDIKAIFNS